MTPTICQIWNPETGIIDIESDWRAIRASEVESIQNIWREQQDRLRGTKQLQDFSERLSREWAIETGIIENLYDIERGVTITLIERGFQAELLSHGSTNKPRDYVLQLLRDQKDALDGVFDFVASRRMLSTSYIKELHAALVRSQPHSEAVDQFGKVITIPLIQGDWKTQTNYPEREGTVYTYCPPEQVASEMDRLVSMYAGYCEQKVDAAVRAAWLHHRFTQIHPFQDGNGRVARALASLVLVQAGLFPLVVTRDEKGKYVEALETADHGNLALLVQLIAQIQRAQFRKATAISETMLTAQADVKKMLGGLLDAASRRADDREKNLRKVFDHARALETNTADRLEAIVPDIRIALQRDTPSASVSVFRSEPRTNHWYRSQIVETARRLEYFANTGEYREWISLNMAWQRRAKLVFTFHGLGRPFSGSLVCAPFLEFIDEDEDRTKRTTLVPIAEEAFVFFYSEDEQAVIIRFEPWRERVLTIALQELSQNL
ncbi:cell filamentation protein [uncultured Gammaproteobacteria bacterium]